MTTTTQKTITEVDVTWMIRRDLPDVLAIEQSSFNSAWTEEEFLSCLSHKQSQQACGQVDRAKTIYAAKIQQTRLPGPNQC